MTLLVTWRDDTRSGFNAIHCRVEADNFPSACEEIMRHGVFTSFHPFKSVFVSPHAIVTIKTDPEMQDDKDQEPT